MPENINRATSSNNTHLAQPQILLLQPNSDTSALVEEMVRRAITAVSPDSSVRTAADLSFSYFNAPESIPASVKYADLVVANLDGGNAGVLLGLGAAIGQSKPIILIAPSGRAVTVPTGLLDSRLFVFSLDSPDSFVGTLALQIQTALGQNTPDNPEDSPEDENSVFISYCHRDAEFLNRLMIHLRPLDKAGLIKTWADIQLQPGDQWQEEIAAALRKAKVAVLLVSADFMASDFITDNELPPLLERAQSEGTRIVPVIVKPCRFTRDQHLRRFQAVNDPRQPLISMDEASQEEVYDRIAIAVESAVR